MACVLRDWGLVPWGVYVQDRGFVGRNNRAWGVDFAKGRLMALKVMRGLTDFMDFNNTSSIDLP
jgi:hypothetical protein